MLYRRFATFLCLWTLLWWLPCFPATADHNAFAAKGFLPLNAPLKLDSFWLKAADGRDLALRDLWSGPAQTLFLHLWAPSCLPCVKEIKELDAAFPRLKDQGIHVIALAQDHDGIVTVPAFARRQGILNLPLYIDVNRLAWQGTRARGLPVTYQIDGQGRVLAMHEGAVDWASLH
jgi:peroxiredoxin